MGGGCVLAAAVKMPTYTVLRASLPYNTQHYAFAAEVRRKLQNSALKHAFKKNDISIKFMPTSTSTDSVQHEAKTVASAGSAPVTAVLSASAGPTGGSPAPSQHSTAKGRPDLASIVFATCMARARCRGASAACLVDTANKLQLGLGCPRNTEAALAWLHRAAEAGCRESALAVAVRLLLAPGAVVDVAAAVKWLREAARPSPDTPASQRLGLEVLVFTEQNASSSCGHDSDSDEMVVSSALQGFSSAGGAAPAQHTPSTPPPNGNGSAGHGATHNANGIANATPATPSPPSRAVWQETLRAAESGDAAAQNDVGVMYNTGQSPDGENGRLAKEWFEKAASAGNVEANINLAFMFVSGRADSTGDAGSSVDLSAAHACLRRAAEAGHPAGMNDLGVMLQHGHGCERNPDEALHWFSQAVQAGNADARVNLAVALAKRGVAHEAQARQLMQEAIEAGHPNAEQAFRELFGRYTDTSPMRQPQLPQTDQPTTDSSNKTPGTAGAAAPASSPSIQAGWTADEDRALLSCMRVHIQENFDSDTYSLPKQDVCRLADCKEYFSKLPWMEIAKVVQRVHGHKRNAKKCRARFTNHLAMNLGPMALRVVLEHAAGSASVRVELLETGTNSE